MRIQAAIFGVVVLAIFAVACDGGGDASPDGATASPTVGEASTPQPGSQASRTPAPQQLAADAGRTDCDPSWYAYQTEVFSICYPPDLFAEVLSSPVYPTVLQIRLIPGDTAAAAPYTLSVWGASSGTAPDVEACLFIGEEGAELDEQTVGQTDLGLLTAETCTAKLLGQTQFYGVATTEQSTIAFKSQTGTDEQFDLAKQILASLTDGGS